MSDVNVLFCLEFADNMARGESASYACLSAIWQSF